MKYYPLVIFFVIVAVFVLALVVVFVVAFAVVVVAVFVAAPLSPLPYLLYNQFHLYIQICLVGIVVAVVIDKKIYISNNPK